MSERPPLPLVKRRQLIRDLLHLGGAALLFSVTPIGRAAVVRGSGIVAVRVWPAADYTRVAIEYREPLKFSHFTIKDPDRLVVDLEGKWQIKAPGVPKNSAVTNVRLGKDDDKTRIVIDLKGKLQPRFILSKDGRTLDIRIDN